LERVTRNLKSETWNSATLEHWKTGTLEQLNP